ncbi:hypothetical protein [Rhabdothermincola sp.]|uniref:hypothetical protein n=1 Tax=Rhabdothermincola sp. TaxID=2820405 RepID=UPI002FE0FA92
MTAPLEVRTAAAPSPGNQLVGAAYDLLVVAAAGLVHWLGPDSLEAALGTVALAWLVISLLCLPGWRRAGAGLFIGVAVVLLLRNEPGFPLNTRLWAFASIGATYAGLRLLPLQRTICFPLVQLYLVVQLVYLVVAALLAQPPLIYADTFTVDVRTAGFTYLTLFTVVLVATSTGLERVLARLAPDKAPPERPIVARSAMVRAWMLIAISLLASGAIQVLGLSSSFGSLTTLVKLAGIGGGVLLARFWLDGILPPLQRLALLVAAGLYVISGLGSAVLYESALPAYVLLVLIVAYRRYIPWLFLLLGAVALVLVNVSKTEFRTARNTIGIEGSAPELGLTYLDLVAEDLSRADENVLANSAYRFANYSDQLGYFVTWVPDRYPYYGYSTYLNLPRVLIPRFLDPSKPTYNAANEVGRRYELISASDFITSVNPSPAAEAYVAGGTGFMLAVAAAMGAYLTIAGFVLRSRRVPVLLTGVLMAFSVMSAVESGVLSLFLSLPFGLLLYPLMRWVSAEGPADQPRSLR